MISSGTPNRASASGERQTHRPAGGPLHHLGHHAEPRVVIDAGDQLRLPHLPGAPVDQPDAADDVDAPQLHRPGPFEPHGTTPAAASAAGPAADPAGSGSGRSSAPTAPPGLGARQTAAVSKPDPPRPPPRMLAGASPRPPPRPRRHLMRARLRPVRPIHQPAQLLSQIPAHPPMHRRPMHPSPAGDLGDIRTAQHRPHRIQPLLDDRQDNQRQSRPPRARDAPRRRPAQGCRTDPVSHISWRTTVAHHPTEDRLRAAWLVRTFSTHSRPDPARPKA